MRVDPPPPGLAASRTVATSLAVAFADRWLWLRAFAENFDWLKAPGTALRRHEGLVVFFGLSYFHAARATRGHG